MGRTGFQVGDLAATSLVDGSCDAAMSLDVLLFVPDQAAPLREVARIPRADGLFALTSWEQSGYSARLGALQVADYRPLLDAAGFAAEVYEEPPDWQRHQRALVEGIIAAEMELADEFGMAAAARYSAYEPAFAPIEAERARRGDPSRVRRARSHLHA